MAALAYTAAQMCDILEAQLNDATASRALGFLNRAYLDLLYGAVDPRNFATHAWRFLKVKQDLTVWATTTGTAATAVAGVGVTTITTAAATFFATMVGHALVFDDSGDSYTVASYVSATEITVTGDASGEAGNAFTLTPTGRYPFSAAAGGVTGRPVFVRRSGQTDTLGRLKRRSVEAVDQALADAEGEADQPRLWATEPTAGTAGSSLQAWGLVIAPIPDDEYDIRFPVRATAEALTDAAVYLLGGPEFHLAVLAAAKALVEAETGETVGVEAARARTALIAAIDADRTAYSAAGEPEDIEDD